jgi:hypothetical protein
VIRELDVQGKQRGAVTDADFDIRAKAQAVNERRGFEVTAKEELAGVDGGAGPHAERLRRGRRRKRDQEQGGQQPERRCSNSLSYAIGAGGRMQGHVELWSKNHADEVGRRAVTLLGKCVPGHKFPGS